IPTGASDPFGPIDDLLGETSRDDGFALNQQQDSFSIYGGGYGITVEFLEGYPYAQVFAPKEKEFIALEPMTAPTAALSSGDGIRILAPGDKFRASFRIIVHTGEQRRESREHL
ncbi:MAG: hypothetical protein WBU20_01955, partial [Candidatus Acidiferrum sp.]